MKILRILLLAIVGLLPARTLPAADIQKVEPPFWYVGMEDNELQVLVYGEDISSSTFSIEPYKGVEVKEVRKVDSPNYLFVYLDISNTAQPGEMTFKFTDGGATVSKRFELRPRNTKPGALGFGPEDVLYLITPDRFANGDAANDTLEMARVNRSRSGGRHGGDIKGIVDHLDYIKELGVTAIWLNPVQKNSANTYHGYAITDFYDIDPRFGTLDDYIDFVDKAHSMDLKVVMDMIFNHCGSSHWWMEDLPTKDWLNYDNTFVPTSHQKWTAVDPHAAPSEKKAFTDGWFNRGMPDLNQRNPLVSKYLIQNSMWWIETARIDGVRQDTHPYMDAEFGAKWCKATFEEYPDFNITGETWYPVGSGFPAWWQRDSKVNEFDTGLKTVMDFNLAFLVPRAFEEPNESADGRATGLFTIYVSMASDFLYKDQDNILVFLDNHDLGRFSKVTDVGLNKYKQGIAFILTTRGIPQIYYGTELLFTATKEEGDGAIRKDMPGGWAGDTRSVFTAEGRTEAENMAWNYMSRLLHWRRTSKAVTRGRMIQYAPLSQYGDCYVYARIKDDHTVLVILNGSDKDADLDMSRYSDVIKDFTRGVEVSTGEIHDITTSLHVPARGTFVMDLTK